MKDLYLDGQSGCGIGGELKVLNPQRQKFLQKTVIKVSLLTFWKKCDCHKQEEIAHLWFSVGFGALTRIVTITKKRKHSDYHILICTLNKFDFQRIRQVFLNL